MHACHRVIQIKEPDPFPSPGKKSHFALTQRWPRRKSANMRGKRSSRINFAVVSRA